MGYERQIASAQKAIAKKGEACDWKKPADADPAADPWRDERTGEPPSYPVKIAWFSPRDLGRGTDEFLAAIAGTEVPAGVEIGLMAGGQEFEPELTDTIVRTGGVEVKPLKIDRLAPDGTPILYYVRIAA